MYPFVFLLGEEKCHTCCFFSLLVLQSVNSVRNPPLLRVFKTLKAIEPGYTDC